MERTILKSFTSSPLKLYLFNPLIYHIGPTNNLLALHEPEKIYMLRILKLNSLRIFVPLLSTVACYGALTFDNQYFPFGDLPYTRKWHDYSNIIPGMMVNVADHSRDDDGDAQALFQLFGTLDLRELGRALETVGKPNPLRSQFRASPLPVRMAGELEGIGGTIEYNQALGDHWSFGAATGFMRLTTYPRFILDRDNNRITIPITGQGDLDELDRTLREMADLLCLQVGATQHFAMTDLDTYLRYGGIFEYPAWFRRIDVGIRGGFIAPIGKKRDIYEAFSIPFAGNGLWGLYAMGDIEFELKEDLKLGLFCRVQQRLPKNQVLRVPVLNEPLNFGAIVGDFRIHPGTMVAFSAYLLVEDLRGGLGGSAQYLFIKQFRDHIIDERPNQNIPVNRARYDGLSSWQSEVISARMFYDFSRTGDEECKKPFLPIISFAWDFPVKFLGAHRVSKTNRISVTVEIPY